jgi:hypothetical protein
MISFTKVETKEINEEDLFEDLKAYLFEDEVLNVFDDYVGMVKDLPKDVQRLIFAKVGAMMIDYAGSEEF